MLSEFCFRNAIALKRRGQPRLMWRRSYQRIHHWKSRCQMCLFIYFNSIFSRCKLSGGRGL